MITKKGHACPPYAYLFQIANHYPNSVAIYMQLWDDKDDFNRIKVYLDEIRLKYLITYAKFNHQLLYLVKEGLASVTEKKDKDNRPFLFIELTGWDNDEVACW